MNSLMIAKRSLSIKRWIRSTVRGMEDGHPLQSNLAQCNKLKNKKMGLCIIFKEAEGTIQVIQVVAIGKRDKEKIYKMAEDRLS